MNAVLAHPLTSRRPRRLRDAAIAALMGAAPMLAGSMAGAMATPASAEVLISANFAPPPLPIYEQPVIPGPDYIWQPGFWAWDRGFGDYYWVPGVWIQAPQPGYLWTPGYWGWNNGAYLFHDGYWGPTIGYYGGVFYGFGYTGHGYDGGYWNNNHFFYNRTVNNIGAAHITNVYNKTVMMNAPTRASFNGPGGVSARPTAQEAAAQSQRHIPATAAQMQNQHAAAGERSLRASANHGAPPIAATAHPGQFHAAGVVSSRAGSNPTQPPGRPAGARAGAGGPAGAAGKPGGGAPAAATVHAPRAATPVHQAPAAARQGPAAMRGPGAGGGERPPVQHRSRPPSPSERFDDRAPSPQARMAPREAMPAREAAPAPRERAPSPQFRQPPPQARAAPQGRPQGEPHEGGRKEPQH